MIYNPTTQNWDELISRILASGKKQIYWNQNRDGTPTVVAKNLCQLHFVERQFRADDLDSARRYADLYGIEIDL